MSEEKADSMNGWTKHFENFCASDELSIDEMRRMTEGISLVDLSNSSFLHQVCFNENVTLEIVEYILDLYPPAIFFKKDLPDDEVKSAYPLHLACFNDECPNEVIQLLLKRLGDSTAIQLAHICMFHEFRLVEIRLFKLCLL